MGKEKGANSNSNSNSYKGWWRWWWLILLMVLALLVGFSLFTLWRAFHGSGSRGGGGGGGVTVEDDKYAAALAIAMQFFDVQKSGRLVDNKISWRGDSGTEDGSEANLDLSKGMYDAGDLIKFGFPMAFTATVLSWSILEYGHQMKVVNELEHAQDSLKWITDYLINAHPSDNELYIQVGDPELDHNCWERPEAMTEKRPLTQVNVTHPGTEVAAETAAAMASAALVFRTINSTYSKLLLRHAEQLFAFADTFRASYSISIPQVGAYYNSTGYGDELLWTASWLYIATKDLSYLRYATVENGKRFANWGSPSSFNWDNKLAGTQVLLSKISFFGDEVISTKENLHLQMYRKSADAVMCRLLPDSPTTTSQRTYGGLIWVSQWDALQHSVAFAFLALVYSNYMLRSHALPLYCGGKLYEPIHLRNFAISQADYILGNNPMKMSYVVGYGMNYPKYVHHRGASIPADANTSCRDGFKWLSSPDPNPNIAIGALVGGPFLNETYVDSRENSMQGEPTTYNNALLVALLSGLVSTS